MIKAFIVSKSCFSETGSEKVDGIIVKGTMDTVLMVVGNWWVGIELLIQGWKVSQWMVGLSVNLLTGWHQLVKHDVYV